MSRIKNALAALFGQGEALAVTPGTVARIRDLATRYEMTPGELLNEAVDAYANEVGPLIDMMIRARDEGQNPGPDDTRR